MCVRACCSVRDFIDSSAMSGTHAHSHSHTPLIATNAERIRTIITNYCMCQGVSVGVSVCECVCACVFLCCECVYLHGLIHHVGPTEPVEETMQRKGDLRVCVHVCVYVSVYVCVCVCLYVCAHV